MFLGLDPETAIVAFGGLWLLLLAISAIPCTVLLIRGKKKAGKRCLPKNNALWSYRRILNLHCSCRRQSWSSLIIKA